MVTQASITSPPAARKTPITPPAHLQPSASPLPAAPSAACAAGVGASGTFRSFFFSFFFWFFVSASAPLAAAAAAHSEPAGGPASEQGLRPWLQSAPLNSLSPAPHATDRKRTDVILA
jgi:hypothetical protein